MEELKGYEVDPNAKDITLEEKLFKKILGAMIDPEFQTLSDAQIFEIADGAIISFKELNKLERKTE
jgi:hypothetical protein